MFATAAIVAAIGSFNGCLDELKTPHRYFFWWLGVFVPFFLLALGIIYLGLPALVGPFWGAGVCILTLLFLVLGAVVHGLRSAERSADFPLGIGSAPLFVILALLLVSMGFRGCAGANIWQASSKSSLIGSVESRNWQEDLGQVDVRHIRVVPREMAEYLGNKVLGEADRALASRFKPGEYAIQHVDGNLYWVAPLEFRDFRRWSAYSRSPGYIMVSAEDRNQSPQLVTDLEQRYMPSAYFSENLKRHIYQAGYTQVRMYDFNYLLDDSFRPFWVVSLSAPSIHYSGQEVVGVLVVCPQTGAIDEYQMGDVPDWIDRVIPEKIALQYMSWWGSLSQGWWNSVWIADDVVSPTQVRRGERSSQAAWLVWGKDGEPYWFTGITSTATSDDALVGFLLMNSRTGETFEYRLSGAAENAVMEAVNAEVSNYEGFRATQPILYNIYGRLAWVIPVLRDNHLRRLAIVDAQDIRVALGETKSDALERYRDLIGTGDLREDPSPEGQVVRLQGTVLQVRTDVRAGNQYYLFVVEEKTDKIFSASSVISPVLPFLEKGDRVDIEYLETRELLVPLTSFNRAN